MVTKVTIIDYGVSLNRGLRLINRFKKANDINFRLDIKLDLAEKDLGYFWYDPKDNVIYINPINCKHKKFNDMLGHPKDNSIYATISHEFGHFLDLKYNLLAEYTKKNFALKRLILTSHGKKLEIEELADMLQLYLTNPYYLKLIDIERYNWVKGYFKSPRPCGIKTFMKYYNNWPKKVQQKFCDNYGFIIKNDTMEKLK